MLKKNLRILLVFLLLVVITLSSTFVFATDAEADANAVSTTEATNEDEAVTTTEEASPTNENGETATEDNHENEESSSMLSTDNLKNGDVYLCENKDVVVDYMIDGNLFVIAPKVTITSGIGGDVFIIAKEVEVGQEASIYNNMFVVANKIDFKGFVYDLYAVANDFTLSNYVYRDLKVAASNSVSISGGVVGRNAYLYGTSNISFTDNGDTKATISGDLEYSASDERISTDIENVSGSVIYHKISDTSKASTSDIVKGTIFKILITLVFIAIIWLISLAIAPKFTKNSGTTLSKKISAVILSGLGGFIIIPILSIALMLTIFGIYAGLLLLILYFILLAISTPVIVIALNNLVCDKFKVEKTPMKFLYLLITGLVISLISLIPVVGGLISFVTIILGIGLIITNIFSNIKHSSNNKKEEKNKPEKTN